MASHNSELLKSSVQIVSKQCLQPKEAISFGSMNSKST